MDGSDNFAERPLLLKEICSDFDATDEPDSKKLTKSIKLFRFSSNDGKCKIVENPREVDLSYGKKIEEARDVTLELKAKDRRILFFGDIHGCINEFNRMLEMLEFNKSKDLVVLLGDLVGKGPSPLEVIDRAIEIGAIAVRGNHDDLVLRWRNYLDKHEGEAVMGTDGFPYSDFRVNGEHINIARMMDEIHYQYLLSLPVILKIKTSRNVIIGVHAGLDPSKSLFKQDCSVIMRMRNILDGGNPVSKKSLGGAPWYDVWNKAALLTVDHSNSEGKVVEEGYAEDLLPCDIDLIVYGHDAGRELQIHERTLGLDSGAVYGKYLSAYVYPDNSIIQLSSNKYSEII
ncbi:Bis(5'-nucleosyl)-tetraphosphatase, symmetrical [Zancudomyces culisetae]|uniref:Bis(5'-nucleosyl)-tetraphosphatase, symmetrical n=1 Tax=Zancudomyces culisetae TaxID=1213189 RepID=A0A1R1PMB7_ZANCU|nr:Bis(5'-nucleosyl)-tetraphosphatase, symmetrical [Zancudomyces culisetae]|eukprot:OMH82079.1 Bis(5'-nucleosyl)-tetraphosphatase, symmetrical [Zancudomyces culisetae]